MLKRFKNIHKGKRCFIIGTGPSLNKTNLSLLKDEICFGVNTLYRGLDSFGIKCQYWAASDLTIINNHNRNILQNLDTTLFICHHDGNKIKREENDKCKEVYSLRFIGGMSENEQFSTDPSNGVFHGNTVIIDICLQVAYFMGFSKVYLIGCDSDYSGMHRFDGLSSDVEMTSAIQGDFSNIFKAYKICKNFYETNGREIINCTVGGKLEIFKRQTLEEVMNEPKL